MSDGTKSGSDLVGSANAEGEGGSVEPVVGPGAGIAYPMAAIGVVNLWAAVHYWLAARRYREDLAETAKLNAALL